MILKIVAALFLTGIAFVILTVPLLDFYIEYYRSTSCKQEWAHEDKCVQWAMTSRIINPGAFLKEVP
jgi:hypothetical protein